MAAASPRLLRTAFLLTRDAGHAEDLLRTVLANDPDAPQTIDVVWPGRLSLTAALNTPGQLEVLINGEVVYDIDSWGYGGGTGLRAKD